MSYPVKKSFEISPSSPESKLFFCLSGTSESGKSHFTWRLHNAGIGNRIKYLKVAEELSEAKYAIKDPFYFLSDQHSESSENYLSVWNRIHEITTEHSPVSVIETIKHPLLLTSLGNSGLNLACVKLFFDAPFELRVQREAVRLGEPFEKVKELVQQKDDDKLNYGLEAVRQMSDFKIINKGSISEYDSWIDDLISDVVSSYPNCLTMPVIDYS